MKASVLFAAITSTAFSCCAAYAEGDLRPVVDPEVVINCFETAPFKDPFPECIGDAANQCIALPWGSDTIGISKCYMSEVAVWEQLTADEIVKLENHLENSPSWSSQTPAELVADLHEAQFAWSAYRDAECSFRYNQINMGTARSTEAALCSLRLTAARALEIKNMRMDYET